MCKKKNILRFISKKALILNFEFEKQKVNKKLDFSTKNVAKKSVNDS
jgi:hypothetical protein